MKSEIQRLESDKEKLQDKTKRMQKDVQNLEEKNRQLQAKLDEASSGYTQRIKNGQKIKKEEIESPEFMTFLRDQIADLN